MRTDDPVILKQIQQLEATAEALRRICGFPPRVELPETTASREPKWCQVVGCTRGYQSQADLDHHVETEHEAA